MSWTCCKRRRMSIVKRWTDHEGFHEILKCRWCDWHERRDIAIKVSSTAELTATKRSIADMPAKTHDNGTNSPPVTQVNTPPTEDKPTT